MSKRNIYLETEEDEDESVQSEIDDVADSRVSKLSNKRRKLSHSDEEAPSDTESVLDDENGHEKEQQAHLPNSENGNKDTTSVSSEVTPKKSSTLKVLTPAQLEKAQQKARKTGVIYISRIPPFMKPTTLRQLLSPYGTILRIFLTPEPTARYQARVRAGGNKKRSFVDGWVEFESKSKAKVCAETLNGNILGGKKRGWYHDDIWNMKYLRGFKWNDLMEQVQSEEREREGRLRAEIQKEARERKAFLSNVEQAKIERGIEAKRAQKDGSKGAQADGQADTAVTGRRAPQEPVAAKRERPKMNFRQNAVRQDGGPVDAPKKPASIAGVLSKIF